MASLEQAGAWLANEGEAVMQQGARRIAALEAAADSWQNLAIERDSAWRQDPFKLYLTSAHASGETIARLLDARGCVAEMSDGCSSRGSLARAAACAAVGKSSWADSGCAARSLSARDSAAASW